MSPPGRPKGEYRSAQRRTLEMARNQDRLARGEPLNNSVVKG